MKRILLLLLCTIGLTTQAQEYFVDGYTFTYGVAKQDSLYSIVATVKSNCMVFLHRPVLDNPRPARTPPARHSQNPPHNDPVQPRKAIQERQTRQSPLPLLPTRHQGRRKLLNPQTQIYHPISTTQSEKSLILQPVKLPIK